MSRVHWLGAGLSSGPGIRRVARSGVPLTLWNRTVDKAKAVLHDIAPDADVRAWDLGALRGAVRAGDVVVSMLPAPMHPEVARVCLDAGCALETLPIADYRKISDQFGDDLLGLLPGGVVHLLRYDNPPRQRKPTRDGLGDAAVAMPTGLSSQMAAEMIAPQALSQASAEETTQRAIGEFNRAGWVDATRSSGDPMLSTLGAPAPLAAPQLAEQIRLPTARHRRPAVSGTNPDVVEFCRTDAGRDIDGS